jgi:hypothetical protein
VTKSITRSTLLAIALLAAAFPAVAQNATDLAAIAERYPNSAWVQRRLLTQAREARDDKQIELVLGRLAAMGYGNGTPIQASRLFATVPSDRRLIEGVAWDEKRRRLFVTSVVGRELLYHEGERWHAVADLNAGSLAGIVIDQARRLLWVASGATERTPSRQTAFRGLIAIGLDDLRVVRRLAVKGDGSPSDLGIGVDGAVYAADPQRGAIYRAVVDNSELSEIVAPGLLNSPQGLAPSADGRLLYVADYGLGIRVIDLEGGAPAMLTYDAPAMLDGIDGLVAYERGLIAIQNGVEPRRIIRLGLSGDGKAIARLDVLERAHPEWGEPTLGFVLGRDFFYVADGQGDRFGPDGAVIGDKPLRATPIRALSLPTVGK